MRLNRAFALVYLLMERGSLSAKEAAEHFEVSVRTIFRDVEALSEAGVPIYAAQGRGGGLRLAEGYALSKALLSKQEQKDVLTALRSLAETTDQNDSALTKLSGLFGRQDANWIDIDFNGWSPLQKQRFTLIKAAILGRHVLEFDYYNAKGEGTHRRVEPMQLRFLGSVWYLNAFCLQKQAMRVFRLTRIRGVRDTGEGYAPRLLPQPKEQPADASVASERRAVTHIRLWIDASQGYRVMDDFEEYEVARQPDGSFIADFAFPLDEWVYGMLLSYGATAKVLQPESVKQELIRRAENLLAQYAKP